MAGVILTPITLWNDFKIDVIPTASEFNSKVEGELTITDFYIQGRSVAEDAVQIYCKQIKKSTFKKGAAVLLIKDFDEKEDDKLAIDLATRGYAVYQVDIGGATEGKEKYTEYPARISHANYQNVKDGLTTVKGEVRQTCWYEWCVVIKYVLKYLTSQEGITSIGGLGVGKAATALWMVAGSDESLSCVAFMLNAGWSGYRGIYKFAGKVEPQFSDNMYKFIAGIDAQSYAMHVKCPALVLSALNSNQYDCDRAADTIARMEKSPFNAVNYCVQSREKIDACGYQDLTLFFEKFLAKKQAERNNLPDDIEVKCDLVDGKIKVEVSLTAKNLKNLSVFVSEEITNPALRCWHKVVEGNKINANTYEFTYCPKAEAEVVCAFAQAEYKNGFTISSNIVAKRFTSDQVDDTCSLNNLIYSSRIEGMESIFCTSNEKDQNNLVVDCFGEREIEVNKGPMQMEGVYSKGGLLTFKTAAKTQRPKDDAMLMFDYYSKESSVLTVKMIANYLGDKIEYLAVFNCRGGDVWHNVKLERNKFKTIEGMVLKSYEKIEAIAFESNGEEWLINNALWV